MDSVGLNEQELGELYHVLGIYFSSCLCRLALYFISRTLERTLSHVSLACFSRMFLSRFRPRASAHASFLVLCFFRSVRLFTCCRR